jgi:hypothetical protein
MTFHINISGAIDAAKTEIHDEIVRLAQELHDAVAKLEGVKVEAGNVGTPTSGQSLTPPPPQLQVTGDSLSTKPDGPGGSATNHKP